MHNNIYEWSLILISSLKLSCKGISISISGWKISLAGKSDWLLSIDPVFSIIIKVTVQQFEMKLLLQDNVFFRMAHDAIKFGMLSSSILISWRKMLKVFLSWRIAHSTTTLVFVVFGSTISAEQCWVWCRVYLHSWATMSIPYPWRNTLSSLLLRRIRCNFKKVVFNPFP